MAKTIPNNGYFSISEMNEEFYIDRALISRYENKRLISAKLSAENKHVHSHCDKVRLKFITRARHVDYTLKEIEALIGTVSPYLSESDKIEESISFAENKFSLLRKSLEGLDVLERVNVTCDLELLGSYLVELNTLRSKNDLTGYTRKTPGGIKLPPVPHRPGLIKVKEPRLRSGQGNVFGIRSPHLKIPYLIAVGIVLVTLGGYFALGDMFTTTGRQSAEIKVDRDTPPEEDRGANPDIDLEKTADTFSSDGSYLEAEKTGQPLLVGVTPNESSTSGERPLTPSDADISGHENDAQQAASQPETALKEASELEMIEKIINDMSAKYKVQKVDDGGPAGTASPPADRNLKKTTDPEAAESEGPPPVPLVAASTEKPSLKKSSPDSKGTQSAVPTRAASKKKTSKKKEINAPEIKTKAAGARAPVVKQQDNLTQPPKAASAGSRKTGKTRLDSTDQKPRNTMPDESKMDANLSGSDVALKSAPERPVKTPSKAESSTLSSIKAEEKANSAAVVEASQKATNIAALEWITKSRESYRAGDVGETIVAATVAISIDPNQSEPYLNRARAYNKKGLHDKAIEDATRAIKIDKNSAEAYDARAVAYKASGQTTKAGEDFQEACDLGFDAACKEKEALGSGDTVAGLLRQSREGFKERDWDAVVALSSKVLALDPDNVVAYINRSAAYLQQRSYQKAISDCNAALRIDPDYALAYNNRGYAYEKLERRGNAEKDYKKACSLGLKLGCKNYEKF